MKLLSINLARAIWLFPLTDLNPRGKVSGRNGLLEIGERYGFSVTPSPGDLITARQKNEAVKFLGGTFTPPKKESITVDLEIYRDGLVANTRSSTRDSASFIEDLLRWGSKELGLEPHETLVRTKLAVSEVYVSTDKQMNFLNPKLAGFSKTLASKVPGHPGVHFELGALAFWPDQTLVNRPIPFRFERADATPFAENRYYSIAPVETEDHLELLDKLEGLIA